MGSSALFAVGDTFDFTTYDFLGVSKFEITGIDPSAALDPTDITAFLTGITFMGTGSFTGTMEAITANVSATPLPASLPLFAGGLGMMGLFMQRRRRKAQSAA